MVRLIRDRYPDEVFQKAKRKAKMICRYRRTLRDNYIREGERIPSLKQFCEAETFGVTFYKSEEK